VPHLVALLRSPHDNVREQAIWALGNIVGDSVQCRDHVLSHGAMPLLRDCFTDMSRESLVRTATWALSNFCKGKPQPSFEVVQPALGVLAYIVRGDDPEVLADACWALSYLSNDKIQAVLDAGVLPRVVQLLDHADFKVQTPALRCIGNMVTGNERQTQKVVDSKALVPLAKLLERFCDTAFAETAAIALSVIERCASVDANSVLESGVLSKVATLTPADLTLEMKQSIARTVFLCYNSATPAQLDDLADTGIFSQMYVIRDRAATICIAMQDLELPALITLELLDAAFPNDIPMHKNWQLVTAIKHFHQRSQG
jgi:hypothetical protein